MKRALTAERAAWVRLRRGGISNLVLWIGVLSSTVIYLGCSAPPSQPTILYTNSLDSLEGIDPDDQIEVDEQTTYGPGASLSIHVNGAKTVEFADIPLDDGLGLGGVFEFRGHVRSRGLFGEAYLEIRVGRPDQPPVIRAAEPIRGTTDWNTQRVRIALAPGETADRVELVFVLEGQGLVWVDNIILVHIGES